MTSADHNLTSKLGKAEAIYLISFRDTARELIDSAVEANKLIERFDHATQDEHDAEIKALREILTVLKFAFDVCNAAGRALRSVDSEIWHMGRTTFRALLKADPNCNVNESIRAIFAPAKLPAQQASPHNHGERR